MSEADELQARVERFADDALRFIQGLPKTSVAQRIANQLQDSSTSTAANYRGARRGRSRAEFIAKIGLVAEESSVHPIELPSGAANDDGLDARIRSLDESINK